MRLLPALFASTLLLAGCVQPTTTPTSKPSTTKPAGPAEKTTIQRSGSAGVAAFNRVKARVEPVAERTCRSIHPTKPQKFCDLNIQVLNDPKQPPNAFQTFGKDGRPLVIFNINMLRTVKNDDEIAFILGHEAGHLIAKHIEQKVSNQTAGALLGSILIAAAGGNPQQGADLGGFIGGRAYSKGFELQADRIGAHISSRAGYNPTRGSQSFNRTQGSNALLSTHPPSADRLNAVAQTVSKINSAKKQGKTAPVTW